jgi:putative oxidoreductase
MRHLYLVGRVLFSWIFITAAPRHCTSEGIQHAAEFGRAARQPVGSAIRSHGLCFRIAIGYHARWGAWLLGFLVPVTLMMHAYWKLHDPTMVHLQQAMFAKNISMRRAALLITQFGAGEISIDSRKHVD